jgi:hypothetical protein
LYPKENGGGQEKWLKVQDIGPAGHEYILCINSLNIIIKFKGVN